MSTTRAARINQVKNHIAEQFRAFIESEMKRRKMTQAEFGKAVGMHGQAISRMLNRNISVHMGTMIRVYDGMGLVPTIVRAKRKA